MSQVDFDSSILDSTIDDLADYVGFEPLPRGSYICLFTREYVKIGDSELPAVRASFTVKEVVELTDTDATPPAEDRKIGIPYILKKKDGEKNTFSEGQLKKDLLIPFREAFGGNTLGEILDNADGCEVAVTFGIRNQKHKDTGEIMSSNTIRALAVNS